MIRKILIRIFGIVIIVSIVLWTLIATTTMPNEKNNGFTRHWIVEGELPIIKSLPITESLSKIVGISEHSIFLAGKKPTTILIINKDSNKKDTLLIGLDVKDDVLNPYFMQIDTPKLFFHIGNLRSVVSGNFPGESLTTRKLMAGLFSQSIQISPNSIVVRAFDSTLTKQTFKKVDITSGEVLSEQEIIQQVDSSGGASSDGMLIFEKTSANILFVESFRNNIYRIDTNLNLISSFHSIDTVANNNIELVDQRLNDSTVKRTTKEARVNVNKKSFVYNERLYIVSGLRSDDQRIAQFNAYDNIDVYNYNVGRYIGSFRIAKNNSKSLLSVMIDKGLMYVLYENRLNAHKLIL